MFLCADIFSSNILCVFDCHLQDSWNALQFLHWSFYPCLILIKHIELDTSLRLFRFLTVKTTDLAVREKQHVDTIAVFLGWVDHKIDSTDNTPAGLPVWNTRPHTSEACPKYSALVVVSFLYYWDANFD